MKVRARISAGRARFVAMSQTIRRVITWEQGAFGIFTAVFIAAAYAVLYPRKEEA